MMSSQKQPDPSSNKWKTFKNTDHADNISKKLQSFYEKKEFFDIVLIAGVDNVEVHAHRVVLSASSDYFLVMFRSTLLEAKADKVELKEIDGSTLKMIIDFMYTSSIELRCEIVETVLRAADFLQIDTLISACCGFMGEQLDASNCLGIALFAEQRNYNLLHKKASSFAFLNFDKVWTEKEFIQLNEDQLSKLLSSDDYFPHSEEIVFRSLVAWVEYDKENREKLIFNLLSHIRFTLLKPKFIIENRHLVCKNIECYELICTWLEWHLLPESRSQFSKELTKARNVNQRIAFASGESTNDLKIQTFNPNLNTWSYEKLPIPPKKRTQYRAIVINNKLIIVGGIIDGVQTNSVEYLDLQTKEWIDLPPMGLGRSHPALAELNGDLYVVGGYIGPDCLSSVEKYDFTTHEWQDVAPLPSPFDWVQVAVHEEFLYAVGNGCYAMYCYDLGTNKWTQKAYKNEKSEWLGIAVIAGKIYSVGGLFDGSPSQLVECYNISTDTWTVVKSIKEPRGGIRCVAFNNRLIACGGHYMTDIDLVEEYNPETNEWKTLAPLLSDSFDYYSNSVFTI